MRSLLAKLSHYGGWSNRLREGYLDLCVRLLDAAEVPVAEDAQDFAPSNWEATAESERCPACGGPLNLVIHEHRPRWCDLLRLSNLPSPSPLPPTLRSRCPGG